MYSHGEEGSLPHGSWDPTAYRLGFHPLTNTIITRKFKMEKSRISGLTIPARSATVKLNISLRFLDSWIVYLSVVTSTLRWGSLQKKKHRKLRCWKTQSLPIKTKMMSDYCRALSKYCPEKTWIRPEKYLLTNCRIHAIIQSTGKADRRLGLRSLDYKRVTVFLGQGGYFFVFMSAISSITMISIIESTTIKVS